MTPLLTVVVPAYNAEAYLARALDSVVGFGSELEVLVVDDGSTDGTARLAQAYADRYPEEVRLVSKPNGGHGSAINTGLEHARGAYLKVVDAEQVSFEFKAPNKPGVIKTGPDFLYVIMPVNLQ